MTLYNKNIHSKSQLIKSILGVIETPLFKIKNYISNKDLIVLNYHSTPLKFQQNFEQQIQFYKKHFQFISPQALSDYYDNKIISDKPLLLITFDDGLANNKFAIDILDKYQIKALLFIVPDFINSDDHKKYYTTHIRTFINANIDSEKEDFTALNWEDLKLLVDNGHQVGSHTMSHTLRANNESETTVINEILHSKLAIEQKLNCKVYSFCAPFNSLMSVGSNEMLKIKDHYRYFHSTFPGSNHKNKNNYFIKRFNVECFWSLPNIIHTLGYIERGRWWEERKKFNKIIND